MVWPFSASKHEEKSKRIDRFGQEYADGYERAERDADRVLAQSLSRALGPFLFMPRTKKD
tara:strand:+ start:85 stop:264 length:180 start_codon:yes stop_codon:yes gene_type:complete